MEVNYSKSHSATLNGQMPCGSRDITYSICRVNSCDHVFRVSVLTLVVDTTLPSLMTIGRAVLEV